VNCGLLGRPERKKRLARPRCKWKNYIKIGLGKENGQV
jgi:hypothetical protein